LIGIQVHGSPFAKEDTPRACGVPLGAQGTGRPCPKTNGRSCSSKLASSECTGATRYYGATFALSPGQAMGKAYVRAPFGGCVSGTGQVDADACRRRPARECKAFNYPIDGIVQRAWQAVDRHRLGDCPRLPSPSSVGVFVSAWWRSFPRQVLRCRQLRRCLHRIRVDGVSRVRGRRDFRTG
jgi:hypothetical protein